MNVFIVHGADYEDQEVRAIYSSAKLAAEHVRRAQQTWDSTVTWEEWKILDAINLDQRPVDEAGDAGEKKK